MLSPRKKKLKPDASRAEQQQQQLSVLGKKQTARRMRAAFSQTSVWAAHWKVKSAFEFFIPVNPPCQDPDRCAQRVS